MCIKQKIKFSLTVLVSLVLITSCSDDKDKKAAGPTNGNTSHLCDQLRPMGFSQRGFRPNQGPNNSGRNQYIDHSGRQYFRSGNVFTASHNHQEQFTCNSLLSDTSHLNQGCEHAILDRTQNIYYHRDTRQTLATYDQQSQVYISTTTSQQFYCSYQQTTQHNSGFGYNQNFCQVGQPNCFYYGSHMQYVQQPFIVGGIWFAAGFYYQSDLDRHNVVISF